MSKERRGPSLHVEWAPGQVQAVDTVSGRRWAGAALSELPPAFTSGQREALIGIRRSLVFLKTVPLPKAPADDLRRVLAVQIGQLFPLPADQLAFDFIQTGTQTADGWLTLVAAFRAEDLRQLRAELQQAGLRPARILPVALGAAAVAARAGRKDALVIESSPWDYTLDVVTGGMVRFSRTVVSGSDLAGEARRTLAAAGVEDLPVVTVGVEPPSGADAIAASATPLDLLQEAPDFTFELDEERAREVQRRVTARTRLAVLMMLSALLLVALVWADRSDAQAVLTRGKGAWAREMSKLRSIRDTDQKAAQDAITQGTGLKAAFDTAQPLGDIAAVIGDSLPQSSWLTGLSLERGKPVQIRGTAANPDDVARFLRNLAGTGRFRDIKLGVANSAKIDQTTVVQFNVTAVAIGSLPMPTPSRKTAAGAARPRSATTQAAGGSGGSAAATDTAGSAGGASGG